MTPKVRHDYELDHRVKLHHPIENKVVTIAIIISVVGRLVLWAITNLQRSL
jgi:hypothetical protein